MPNISFTFEGYTRTNVEVAADSQGNVVDVSNMSAGELCEKLENGDLYISLVDHIYNSRKSEISITDFEPDETIKTERS